MAQFRFIEPKANCLLHFELTYKYDWVGFDRYERIIYGFRNDSERLDSKTKFVFGKNFST